MTARSVGLGFAALMLGAPMAHAAQCPTQMPKTANAVWNVCDAKGVLVGSLMGQGSVIVLAGDGVPYALPFDSRTGLHRNAVFAYAGNTCVGQAFIIEPGDGTLPTLGQWDGSMLWKAGAQSVSMTAQALFYTETGECATGQHYAFVGGVATPVGKLGFAVPFSLR